MSGAVINSAILAMAPQRSSNDSTASQQGGARRMHLHHSIEHSGQSNDDSGLTSVCPLPEKTKTDSSLANNETEGDVTLQPEFLWSEQKQNFLMIAYSIGYLAFLLPAGVVVELYGGKWVAVIGGAGHVLLNLLAPIAARTSFWAFYSSRIMMGGAEAVVLPAQYYYLTRWVPESEKSKALAVLSMGISFGGIIQNLSSGYLCQNLGWPLVFYLVAALNFVWLLLWALFTTNHPASHPWISPSEVEFITSSAHSSHNVNPKHKHKHSSHSSRLVLRILTSKPVIAILYVNLTHTWFFGVLLSKMSAYMIAVLRMDLEETSFVNSLLQCVILLSVFASGILSDWSTEAHGGGLNKTPSRKIFESIGTFGTATFMILLTQTGCNRGAFIAVLCGAVACIGVITGGSDVNTFDLTRKHASILISVITSANTAFGLFTPSLVTQILDQSSADRLHDQWNTVFLVTAGIHCSGGLVFVLLARAERQNWEDKEEKGTQEGTHGKGQ